MRKLLFVLLGCGLVIGAFLLFRHSDRFRQYKIGQEYTVRFNFPGLARQEFTEREKADQDRDWLLYSLVAAAGLDKTQFAQVSFDLAPVRYGFNSTTANFDYGETRSKYLGDGQVIALVPAADENTTNDNIAHILDEVRKNQGEIPHKVYLFEYTLNPEGNFARLIRRDNLSGKSWFTEKKGYFETPVANVEDLRSFMDKIDDVTFAKQDGQTLIVGGRRLARGTYGKATIEDVAAIWQSQKALEQKALDASNNSSSMENDYHTELKLVLTRYSLQLETLTFADGSTYTSLSETQQKEVADYFFSFIDDKTNFRGSNSYSFAYGNDPNLMQLVASMKKEVSDLKATFAEKAQAINGQLGDEPPPSSSGFSLDPAIDCQRSIQFLQRYRALFAVALQGGYTVDQVLDELQKGNGDLMEYAIARVGTGFTAMLGLDDSATQECMYQHARYDGDLQGTAAGMTLFYTDLLAKIWAANMFDSHPDVNITGFKDLEQTSMQTSLVFRKEESTLPNCRLWFGPNKNGFQLGQGKEDIFFAPNATQIFALSHDDADSSNYQGGKSVNKEVQASKEFEVVLTWWNNHYEEVGWFEPQYQRLNEIMKWSTIIGWINRDFPNTSKNLATLDFLDNVSVDHSLWFPTWAKAQAGLRFPDLAKINFYDKGALGSRTEALPILYSAHHMFSGGVSLADRSMLEEAPELLGETKTLARRANLELDPTDPDAFKTFKETKITFTEDQASNQELVKLEPKSGVKLRSRFGEVANTDFGLNISPETNGTFTVKNSIGGLPIGKLSVGSMEGNSFTIGFEAAEVDKGLAISKEISDWKGDPAEFFKNHPDVSRAVNVADNQWCVQLKGSDKWMVMNIDAAPEVDLPTGWTARVSGTDATSQIVEIKWVSEEDAKSLLQGRELPPATADPIATLDFRNAKDQVLDEAKKLESAGNFDQAAELTDKLLFYFGDDASLLKLKARLEMRAALHSFETGNARLGVAWLNDLLASPVNPHNSNAFLKDALDLIEHADMSAEAKMKVTNIVKIYFTDEQVAMAGSWEGYKQVAKEVPLDKVFGGTRTKIIYADNAAFGDIDPNASFETTIGQIRAIPGVRVYDISGEEIGKNTRIYATIDKDPASPKRLSDLLATSTFDRQIAQLKVRVHPGSAYNDCQDKDKNGNCEDKYSANGHVYFVTAPTLN